MPPWAYYNMENEILQDLNLKTGKERPWRAKKVANLLLSEVYKGIDLKKTERLLDCASFLIFAKSEAGLVLDKMNSCRVRLCPMCQWRRSLKAYTQTMKILEYLDSKKVPPAYVFLTLTVRNCTGAELSATIDDIMGGLNRLGTYAAFRKAVRGSYRGLEITHDVERVISKARYRQAKSYYDKLGLTAGDLNPNYNTYHPHVHFLLAVNKSYFKSRDYISQDRWVEYWRRAMRLDYDPVVDVRRTWGKCHEQVAECSKYACKDAEYVIPKDYDLSLETVALLDQALANRRLVAYAGEMRDAHKALNLDDIDQGDLVHVDGELAEAAKEDPRITFRWSSGYTQYFREV